MNDMVCRLRVAEMPVTVRSNCVEFAGLVRSVFAGLADDAAPVGVPVVFDVVRHEGPLRWSICRDGMPCEMDLLEEAAIVQLQWELNRLVIAARPVAVHAAAVSVAGMAVLLAGRSHAGKTTLAGWLAGQAGVEFVADEVSGFDDDGMVCSYARPLGLRAGSPTVRDVWRTDPTALRFMPGEQLVPVTALGATVRRAATPVGLIVFPTFDRDAAGVTVGRLSQADTVERLALLTPGLAVHGRRVFGRLCGLVEAAPAVTVSYADVAAGAAAVIEMVATVGS